MPTATPGLVRFFHAHAAGGSRGVYCVLRNGVNGGAADLLGQTEIQNLGVAAIGDENVRGLDVAVDDALLVRGVKRIGNFDGEIEEQSRDHAGGR